MAARQPTDRARVLVIEDDAELGELMARVLRAGGFEPTVAADGRSGIDQACTDDLDVVIVDVGLPDMSGVAVVRAMRARGYTTPVVMLTAYDTEAGRVAAFAAGADDYMIKPFEVDTLLHRIAAWAARRGSR